MIPAIGIDLGTTKAAAARIDASGRTVMIADAQGETLTPSLVFFGDDEVLVGGPARVAAARCPDRIAEHAKLDLGLPLYSRPLGSQQLSPEAILAHVLRKLWADVQEAAGHEARAVIGVPAPFDQHPRRAVLEAAEMAGLDVIGVISEPMAAALALAESLGCLSASGQAREEMTVFVYDLGGGMFNAALVRLAPGEVRALAMGGDRQLGGRDWDLRLLDHVAERFIAEGGRDPRTDLVARHRLYQQAVEARHTLTARSRAVVPVEHGGVAQQIEVTRDELEKVTVDLVQRTACISESLLKNAGLEWQHVSRVLLVGGATRMPMIGRMIQERTGLAPDRSINPDEAVARGAALYAAYNLGREGGPEPGFRVIDADRASSVPRTAAPVAVPSAAHEPPPMHPAALEAACDVETRRNGQPAGGVPKWLVFVIAYITSAAVGLGLGYWIVMKFFPQAQLPRLW